MEADTLSDLIWFLITGGGGAVGGAAAVKFLPWPSHPATNAMKEDLTKLTEVLEDILKEVRNGFEVNGRLRAAEKAIAVLEDRKPRR